MSISVMAQVGPSFSAAGADALRYRGIASHLMEFPLAPRRPHAMHSRSVEPKPRLDPRLYQIAVLSALLVYGIGWLRFEIRLPQAIVLLGTALLTQLACTRLAHLPRFDPKSALISGLSLCLLLRTDHLTLAALAAIVTIASKFVLRWNGKHLFNP